MRFAILLGFTVTGCAVPLGENVEARWRASQEIVRAREEEANTWSLQQKAHFFRNQTLDRYLASLGMKEHPDDAVVDLEETARLVAITSYAQAAYLPHSLTWPPIFGDWIEPFDLATGHLDGRLAKTVWTRENAPGGLVAANTETHANAYAQTLHALNLEIRFGTQRSQLFALEAIDRILRRYLQDGLRIIDETTGETVPGTDLTLANVFQPRQALMALYLLELADIYGKPETDQVRQETAARLDLDHYRAQLDHLVVSGPGFFAPTHSSVWLSLLSLSDLVQIARDPEPYKRTLDRLLPLALREMNPLWNLLLIEAGLVDDPTDEALELARIRLALTTYPTSIDDSEILNSPDPDHHPYRVRWIKGEPVFEADSPLPIYARPLTGCEWKRNQFRLDGNLGKTEAQPFAGLDYLEAYYLLRRIES